MASRQDIINNIRSRMMKALNEVGKDGVDRIKNDLSTPYPPASDPNTPPHYRSGTYRDSFGYKVRALGAYDVVLSYTCSDPKFEYLEFGTEKMGTEKMAPRPVARPEQMRLKKEIPAVLKKYF